MLYQFEGRPIEGPFISKLPVQQLKPTDAFSALPEWYIDDIAEFILFAMQHANVDIRQGIDHSIITWLLTCVCASHLIKNPYVTAKLVEVMFVFSLKPANSVNTAVSEGNFMRYIFIKHFNYCKFEPIVPRKLWLRLDQKMIKIRYLL